MTITAFKEILWREVETLPETRQADVLTFVRFFKIGLADHQTIERQFTDALTQARAIAAERGISEADIEAEIEAVRAGP